MTLRIKVTTFAWFAISSCGLSAGGQVPYGEKFSLDEVLEIPLTGTPVAAPAGDRLAWVVEQGGRRNVWVARPPQAARQLTRFDEDDGMRIDDLSFSHDGRWLIFVRGGRVNNRGEVYNPRQLPDPVENRLWQVALESGDAQPVESGSVGSPVLGPDGRLFFSRGKEVWARSLEERKAHRLFTIRGSASSLSPSPDGAKLAFVSRRGGYKRGTYSFVGVFDFASRSVTYVAPNVENDVEPTWSPDGKRLAFIRVPIEPKSYRFSDYNDSVPWSIVLGDPATGGGEVIWSADAGGGSGFQSTRGASLHWAGDELVFPWEKTGWKLLYSVSADGGTARLLTPGEHEVASVAVDPDGQTIVYASNRGDVERWHLWKTNLGGGEHTQLTSGAGVERAAVLLANREVAYLQEHANQPSGVRLLTGDGPVRDLGGTVQGVAVFEHFTQPEIVNFNAPDGLQIYGHLYRPAGELTHRAHPVFVYAHGGCHSKSDPVFRSHVREGIFQYLISRGYFVLAVNFRSGTGRGLAFREPKRYGGRGAEEIQDLVGAAKYLAAIPAVDPNAIAICGWSCGGHMVTNALARHSGLYAAGVSYAGVGDWRVEMEMDSGDVMPFRISRRLQLEDLAYESSGVAHIDSWTSPILFIHGDNDLQAAMWPTIEMTLALRRRGVPAETLIFPGEDHGFYLHANRSRMAHRVWQFLDKHLTQATEVAGSTGE